MDKDFILNQAFEESRYHRQFHHVVYTLFITIYIALLGFQISNPDSIEVIRGQTIVAVLFCICIFFIIPFYICYVIVNYHETIAYLNSLIATISIPLASNLDLPMKSNHRLKKALDMLLFGKYRGIIHNGRTPMSVGRGQWFFLITFILVVLCSFIIFMLIHTPVSPTPVP
jgi:hypothetical protein